MSAILLSIIAATSAAVYLTTIYTGRVEATYVIQPNMSNDLSIIRNCDSTTIDNPLTICSGYKTDTTEPSDIRALLQFNISSLPNRQRVSSAFLQLYVFGLFTWDGSNWQEVPSLSRKVEVHRVTTYWKGGSHATDWYATDYFAEAFWRNPGGDFIESATATVKDESANSWNSWDVTEDVKAFYEGVASNHGWILKDADEGSSKGCKVTYVDYTGYGPGTAYSPKLEVTLMKGTSPETVATSFPIFRQCSSAQMVLEECRLKQSNVENQIHSRTERDMG